MIVIVMVMARNKEPSRRGRGPLCSILLLFFLLSLPSELCHHHPILRPRPGLSFRASCLARRLRPFVGPLGFCRIRYLQSVLFCRFLHLLPSQQFPIPRSSFINFLLISPLTLSFDIFIRFYLTASFSFRFSIAITQLCLPLVLFRCPCILRYFISSLLVLAMCCSLGPSLSGFGISGEKERNES